LVAVVFSSCRTDGGLISFWQAEKKKTKILTANKHLPKGGLSDDFIVISLELKKLFSVQNYFRSLPEIFNIG
jgi:hypothetical protein